MTENTNCCTPGGNNGKDGGSCCQPAGNKSLQKIVFIIIISLAVLLAVYKLYFTNVTADSNAGGCATDSALVDSAGCAVKCQTATSPCCSKSIRHGRVD